MGSRLNILLIFFVSVLIGVPVWWKSTEVYRADISAINITDTPQLDAIPIRVSVHLIVNEGQEVNPKALHELSDRLSETLRSIETSSLKSVPLSIKISHVSAIPTRIQQLSPQKTDEWISKQLASLTTSDSQNGRYALVIILNPSVKKPSATIGSHRHAWIEIARLEEANSLLPVLGAQLRHMLINTMKLDNTRKHSYRLVFSLLNEDPSSTVASWNFASLEQDYLKKVVETFSRVHEIEIESQVVHHTQLKREPHFDKTKNEHYFIPATLPHFVDGTEWKVDSGSDANHKSLHFAVFVPSPAHSPLIIHHGPDSVSNAFTVTQWGGVVIHNLPVGGGEERPSKWELKGAEFTKALQVFVSQLRQHLGIPSFVTSISAPSSAIDGISILPAVLRGASEWEIDALSRKQLWHMLHETQHTLTQFNLMMEQIANIPIHDHIYDTLVKALWEHKQAINLLSTVPFDHDQAHTSASLALVAAEDVFFDKDMVGMLYFPSGHELAIYLPLFLPLSFPLVTGL